MTLFKPLVELQLAILQQTVALLNPQAVILAQVARFNLRVVLIPQEQPFPLMVVGYILVVLTILIHLTCRQLAQEIFYLPGLLTIIIAMASRHRKTNCKTTTTAAATAKITPSELRRTS